MSQVRRRQEQACRYRYVWVSRSVSREKTTMKPMGSVAKALQTPGGSILQSLQKGTVMYKNHKIQEVLHIGNFHGNFWGGLVWRFFWVTVTPSSSFCTSPLPTRRTAQVPEGAERNPCWVRRHSHSPSISMERNMTKKNLKKRFC